MEQRRLVDEVAQKSEKLGEMLRPLAAFPHVGEVRQKGFMVGIELVRDKHTKESYHWNERIGVRVTKSARERGLLTRPLGNVIVLIPPLVSTEDDLAAMVDILAASVREVTEG